MFSSFTDRTVPKVCEIAPTSLFLPTRSNNGYMHCYPPVAPDVDQQIAILSPGLGHGAMMRSAFLKQARHFASCLESSINGTRYLVRYG